MRQLIAGVVTLFIIFLITVVPYMVGESGGEETVITTWLLGLFYILLWLLVCCVLGYGVYCLHKASLDFVDWVLER